MLEALNCLASASSPTASVARLLPEEDSLQRFEFLRALAPEMTVTEFTRRVSGAFFLWPRELLEAELNRDALASSVQHNLFDGDPDAWKAYVTHIQKTVEWFGTALPGMNADALAEMVHDAAKDTTPVEASLVATLPAKSDALIEKKGWPVPRSTS